ncbi:transposase [Enterocloster clostridioformis]
MGDFAFRKRYTYGTIMIDIDTHRIIDLLPSREIEDVTDWLSSFPNLIIVSRDGSASYHSAVKQANEKIVQISDRFHLLKGLTDAAKKVITSLVAANIGIPVSASHYEGKETADYWEKAMEKQDFPTREHNAACEKKKKTIEKVLELTSQGWKRNKIAAELGLSYSTVKRYQSPDFNPVHGKYHTTRNSKIKVYEEKIKQMLKENCTFKQIEEAIKKDGYDGASSTIRMYATRERKLMKEAKGSSEEPVEKIERKWLISLLYKPLDDIKKISKEQLDKVIENYPLIGTIHDIVKSFKNTLFSKEPAELEKWLEEAEKLEIEQISSFVNGIRRDMDAVKKAIELDYNNGLAEGSVNKLKVVKRIMYGRNSFELLKGKLLRLELRRRIN